MSQISLYLKKVQKSEINCVQTHSNVV